MKLFGRVDGVFDAEDAGWLFLPVSSTGGGVELETAGGVTYQMILASLAVWLEETIGVPENIRVRTQGIAESEGREVLLCQISEFDVEPYRAGQAPGLLQCRCEVACWGWSGEDAGRGEELADRVLSALQRKTIPLFDYRDTDVPLYGYLKFREGEVMDRTRSMHQEIGRVQRVYVVSVRGVAESLD